MRKTKSSDFICVVQFNHLNNSEIRQPSVVDLFTVQETTDPTDVNVPLYQFTDDIYMLFNADRLSRVLSPSDMQTFVNSLQPHQKSGFDKLTDEQLLQFVKSRHIQSASELLAWSDYLNANYSEVISELEALNKELEPTPESEPTSTE